MDKRYFAYWEDVDYCFRAKKADLRAVYVPKAMVEHHESFSWRRRSLLQKFLFQRNRFYFIFKNISPRESIYLLLYEPRRLISMFYEGFKRILGKTGSLPDYSQYRVEYDLARNRLEFSILGLIQWFIALIASYLWIIRFIFFRRLK